jgi:hypothetical protein
MRGVPARAADNDVLVVTLSLAVPMRIHQLLTSPDRDGLQRMWASRAATEVGSHGDDLMFGSKKKGTTADVFNRLAEGLAALALCPGGVLFAGQHWCVEHLGGSLAVQHGRKLAAADVHSYGTAVCTELGVWSGQRDATGDAVGRAWADAEAIAAQGPVGAGQRLVRDVNSLIADLNSDLDENAALAARDDAVGRAWRAAQRGVVLDDPNEDDGAGHVHEFAGGFACQTCPHALPEDSPETEAHACDPDADGRCLYCREELCRG